jgi:hypothetical protein
MTRRRYAALSTAFAFAAGLTSATPALAETTTPCAEPLAVCPSGQGQTLIVDGRPPRVLTEASDWPGVLRAADGLRGDLAAVAGSASPLSDGPVVIVGTIGRNAVIDRLIAEGRLDVTGVSGVWEGYVQQVVANPLPGVASALIVAGADKRGAIFGAYDISERIGVSPWRWWADVPVTVRPNLFITPGRRSDAPVVRYRGIFLNDEAPALSGWARATFGGFNHAFYERVFDLLLRLKGNYLWPAMWGDAFNADDPLNPVRADEFGIVMGTSHHEPMGRAQQEWSRQGGGAWDWRTNRNGLSAFWRGGMERAAKTENVITIGMRGDGDVAMTEGTAIPLLEDIVASQRRIISEATGRPAYQTPQIWALYKEVQDYYDQGMKTPEDVTLLFADDNWGNIRRLPTPGADRSGGYGVYYHFDYVGGPRNYKWVNTNQIERTWEQMRLADEAGAHQLWIVNVGDLKPMEAPIDFFLDQAWAPETMTLERMDRWTSDWAAAQFGPVDGPAIGDLIETYTRYNSRRKPELITAATYSQIHDREAERVVADWTALADRADAIRTRLRPDQDDAFVELAWFPVQASANLTRLHVATGRQRLYAAQGRTRAAQAAAEEVRVLFARDRELTAIYHGVAGGKWTHMMDQTHISYASWQQPAQDVLPALAETRGSGEGLGVAIEGADTAWSGVATTTALPALDRYGTPSRWIEVFDRGQGTTSYEASSDQPWLRLSSIQGQAGATTRIEVSADWPQVPPDTSQAQVTLTSSDGSRLTIPVIVENRGAAISGAVVEADGRVTIDAADASRMVSSDAGVWEVVPGLGRFGSAVTTRSSQTVGLTPGGESPRLEYDIQLWEAGDVAVQVQVSPTLDFRGGAGLRYAISIDDQPPQVVTVALDAGAPAALAAWERAVGDNIVLPTSRHVVDTPGLHRVKIWLVDSGLVFQRVVVATRPLPRTYLGPQPSRPTARTTS